MAQTIHTGAAATAHDLAVETQQSADIFAQSVRGMQATLKTAQRSFGGWALAQGAAFAQFGRQACAAFDAVADRLRAAVLAARQMRTAAGHLQLGFGQMLSPLVQAVTPALAALTDGLATALAYAGRLFSFLTGKAVQGADGAAQAVAGVGKAATGTAKRTAAAARTLAGFDEITRMAAPKVSGGGRGSGGSKAGGGKAGPGWVAENPFLDRVLAAIQNGDWRGAGVLLAEKMDALLKSWDAAAFGRRLGTGLQNALALFSGFLHGEQWNTLGRTLAQAFNALADAIDPADLAAAVGAKLQVLIRSVGSFFEALDFAPLGAKLGAFAAALAQDLTAALASIDWGAIGSGILRFFGAIDWAALAQALGTLLGTVFQSALAFCLAPFQQQIAEAGGSIPLGLFNGILQALADLPGWIWANIFQPFAAGICAAFGINSPSTVAAQWGGYIIQGLLQGLATAWQQVTVFLAQMQQGFTAVWGAIRTNVTAIVQGLGSSVTAAWQNACSAVTAALSGLQSGFVGIWDAITGTVRGAVETVQGLIARIVSAMQGAAGTINGLIGGITGAVNSVLGVINGLASRAGSALRQAAGALHIAAADALAAPPVLPLPPAAAVPALARGAVIPANRRFLALLGDQPHGTNVEAPLATIEQAVANVLDGQLDALMAGFEAVVAAIREKDTEVYIGDDAIGRAAARYQRRMAVMQGGAV